MAFELTADGLSIQTFDEIFDELATGYRAIYGNDIDLDPDSPDGQRVGIEAKARLDSQTAILEIYNSLDPDVANGVFLTKLIKWAGLNVLPAARSQVDLTITTDRDTEIVGDYFVEDDDGRDWVVESEPALPTGPTIVTAFSVLFGAIDADSDTITSPITVVIGVTSVTNVSPADPGRAEETDQEIRERRARSIILPQTSSVGGVFTALANLAGTTGIVIAENDTRVFDPNLSLEGNTIWVVVEGGDVVDIADVILRTKSAGAGTKGAIEQDVDETLLDGAELPFTLTHTLRFDRPTDVPLYINLTVTRKDAAVPVDLDLIKEKLVEHIYRISEEAVAAELYIDVFKAGTTFVPTDLEISDDDAAFTDESIVPALDDKFRIDLLNIDIIEVIP